MHAAHEIARIEIGRIDPGQQRHVLVLGSERHRHLLRLLVLHVGEQAAHEVGDQVRAERPARPEIAEHPHHVGHAGEHHAAIGDRVGEIERLAVDGEIDVAQHVEIEAGGGDDDVGLELLAGLQANAGLGEALDLVGDHRGLAGPDALEEIAVRHEGDALPPRPVGRREVGVHVVVGAEMGAHAAQQFLLHDFRLFERAAREHGLVVQDLAAHDLVDPGFVDLELAQRIGEVVGVAGGAEIGRRALQQGDVAALARDRRHQRGGRGARTDDDDLLAGIVEILRPGLGVHDAALEVLHPLPFGRVAFGVAVVALAHPQEVRREADGLAGVGARGLDRPAVVLARPAGRGNPVAVADVPAEVVLGNDFAHVGQDLARRRDRGAGPGLEAIAEGVEVAVRADAGVAVGEPRAAETPLRFQDDEARVGTLLGEVIGAADAGDARADDQHIEMLGLLGGGGGKHGCIGHGAGLVPKVIRRWTSVLGVAGRRH